MGIIIVLILLSLVIAAGFLAAFLWAVRDGQYEDDYTPSVRILLDDKTKDSSTNSTVKIL
jgi:cbb3-type cytochrome oxidase maturation protein